MFGSLTSVAHLSVVETYACSCTDLPLRNTYEKNIRPPTGISALLWGARHLKANSCSHLFLVGRFPLRSQSEPKQFHKVTRHISCALKRINFA